MGLWGYASSITWSGGNGTFNPNANDPSATYTPTALEITNGVTLTITTDDPIGPCTSETDDVTFTFVNGPTVDAAELMTLYVKEMMGFLQVLLEVVQQSITWTTNGDGSFSNVTNLNTNYTPGANDIINGEATLFLTTDNPGSPCSSVTDSVKIIINVVPVVSAGLDTTICANGDVNLLGSFSGASSTINWSTSGDGTFNNVNNPNAIYSRSWRYSR